MPRAGSPTPARKLNPRHLQALLVDALAGGITVEGDVGARPRITTRAGTIELDYPFSPDPADPERRRQLDAVIAARWSRGERLGEIVAQQTDLMSFLSMVHPMSSATHPMTMALLDAVHAAIERIAALAKHRMSVVRPGRLSTAVNPVIQTPAHSACPSGHASEAFGLAFVMERLLIGQPSLELRMIAARIEENRVIAGVHYPADGVQGRRLAAALAGEFVERMGIDGGASPSVPSDGEIAGVEAGVEGILDAYTSGGTKIEFGRPFDPPSGIGSVPAGTAVTPELAILREVTQAAIAELRE